MTFLVMLHRATKACAAISELLSFSAARHSGPGEHTDPGAVGVRSCASPWLPGQRGSWALPRTRPSSALKWRPATPRLTEHRAPLRAARPCDPREVSGTDTRARDVAPGPLVLLHPSSAGWGGARLRPPLSPPLLTPRGGEGASLRAGQRVPPITTPSHVDPRGLPPERIAVLPCFRTSSERAIKERCS